MSSSRRGFLSLLSVPLAAQDKAASTVSEWRRYLDPATEFEVIRMTDPQFESLLPPPTGRAVDRRSRFVLYSSNRAGRHQPVVMDLSSGERRVLGNFDGFNPGTLALSSDDREAFFLDGAALAGVQVGNQRRRELARVRDGWAMRGSVAASDDGTHLFYVEAREERNEIRRLRLPKGEPETIIEQPGGILGATPNPRRATVLWRLQGGELWVAGFDGAGKRRVETPAGRVLDAHWSPDGQSLLYLLAPADKRELHTIREQGLDTRTDTALARTSQFGSFGRNANASVFVGASASKASPMVLVLLRSTRREFTLCEHKASDPDTVRPRFTPNSQKVIFESDRHGQRALYLLNVEKLIEKTDS